MRSEFREFFSARLTELQRRGEPRFFRDGFEYDHAPIIKIIPDEWRVDARYYLARNVVLMIIEPYMYVEGDGARRNIVNTRMWPDLMADMQDIITKSEEISRERERGHVSATSVAIALGELAPNLKTTGFQIWGPDEE